MHRGAWRATVHGVAKSRTWLSDSACTSTYLRIWGQHPAFLHPESPQDAQAGWLQCLLAWWPQHPPFTRGWGTFFVHTSRNLHYAKVPDIFSVWASGWISFFFFFWCQFAMVGPQPNGLSQRHTLKCPRYLSLGVSKVYLGLFTWW